MDLITKDSETTLVLFSSLDRVLENVEYVVMNYRPVLNGEHYLTGEEVCERLCISKRTFAGLQGHGTAGVRAASGKNHLPGKRHHGFVGKVLSEMKS